jgi:PKD repeat protein
VVASWQGTGQDKIGVFRSGIWILDGNGNFAWDGTLTDIVAGFGMAGDVPVPKDWNGDGQPEIAVFRPGAGQWYIDYNGNYQWDGTGSGKDVMTTLGQSGDVAIAGNWNGTGAGKPGVFRNGFWILDYNGNFQWDGTPHDITAGFGTTGDVPVLGNWNDVPIYSALVADFTASPLTGTAPLNVTFTDTTTGSPTSWTWSFGDGTTSTQQNPSHTYTAAGTYDVSLTATNVGGSNTKVKTGYVNVTETCPYDCDTTLTNPPYIDFVIYSVSCPAVNSGAWHPAVCVDNTMIRWAMAGKSTPFYSNLSPNMWKRSSCCPNPGHSWAVDSPANKPIYYAAITNPDTANVKYFSHAVAAEYLGVGDVRDSRWQDWKFFNYDELNIQIGWDHQIPNGTSSFNTTVRIDNITRVYGCGQYVPDKVRAFTIDRNDSVSPTSVPMYAPGYLLSKTGKTLIKNQIIPDDIKNVMRSLNDNQQFSISKWEFDPTTEELIVYTYDIGNPLAINDLQKKPVGKYSIRVIHDAEFEKNRAEVQQQLVQLQKTPDYQIAWIAMHTDTINDPPENYVELWVYKSTPENKKLDSTVIKGWKIFVLPVSQLPPEAGKS